MSTRKLGIIANTTFFACLIALLITGSLLDKQISDAFYIGFDYASAGAVFGKLPAWLFGMIACTVLFKNAIIKSDRYKKLLMTVYAIGFIGCAVMFGYSAVEDVLDGVTKYLLTFILAVGAGVAVAFFVLRLKDDTVIRLKKWAFSALVVIVAVIFITTVLKFVWGRTRYLDILLNGGKFTPWYIPQGITGNSSFPSGHVAFAATACLSATLMLSLPNCRAYAFTAYLISIVFIVFIAIMRIMSGHHFLSDVTVSVTITSLVMLAVSRVMFGKNFDNFEIGDKSFLNSL